MPRYDYRCTACGEVEELIHSMSESPVYFCSKCRAPMERQFTPNIGGFIIKGGTPAMHWKEKRQRIRKSEMLAEKQKTLGRTGPKVKPNIAGYETGTWSDAQKMAKEAGLNSDSYTPYVEKEKKEKRSLVI